MDNLNEKYKDLMKAGQEQFWKYGIKKVSIEEICREAGVSRVTFYKYFTNKENMAFTILKSLMDLSIKTYRDFMDSDIPFEEKVKKTIEMKLEFSNHMSHELLNDVLNGDFPKLLEYINKSRETSMKMIESDYRKAQEQGEIRKDLKIELVIYFLNKMQEMVNDPALEAFYTDSGEMIGDLIHFFFYGLASGQEQKNNSK